MVKPENTSKWLACRSLRIPRCARRSLTQIAHQKCFCAGRLCSFLNISGTHGRTAMPGIRPALEPHLPAGVVARGCQGTSRRSPHALFTLLLTEPRAVIAVRQWLASPFLTDLLASLLNNIERGVEDLLRRASR
jgi:hypothetical protein